MPSVKNRKAIVGSARPAMPGAKAMGASDPTERIEVTVLLRSRQTPVGRAMTEDMGKSMPHERQYLTHEEFAAQRGASPDDFAAMDAFANSHNLTVVSSSLPRRTIRLAGTVKDLSAAFGAKLKKFKKGNITFRGRTGELSVPKDVHDIVQGVFGFDNRPIARPHSRILGQDKVTGKAMKGVGPKNNPGGSFSVPQVAQLYNFPAGLDGSGQTIAILELNGRTPSGKMGTGFTMSDLNKFFSGLGLATPSVSAIGVDGGGNFPGTDPGADGEVALDIEVAGAVAPKAKIAVYFAPNTTKGFIDCVSAAVHDPVRKPSVLSISWGGSEDSTSSMFLNGLQQVFNDAAMLGVTITASAGDDGSADVSPPIGLHVDFPASLPNALACGGTRLQGTGSTITSEVVWNDFQTGNGATGGGVSNIFPRPSYQANAKVPKSPHGKVGRGVPDIAGNADPFTGYEIVVGGKKAVIGGTSAVSPLWAGLLALINQRLVAIGSKPVGFINPLIYDALAKAGVFHDITSGNNNMHGTGKYPAGPGWDACTGMGTPDGTKLLKALGG